MGDITAILRDLAEGRIDAAEAQRLIALDRQASSPAPASNVPTAGSSQSETVRPFTPRGSARGVERISLRTSGRRLRLIGDPEVATVVVSGPHEVRHLGPTVEITSEGEASGRNPLGVLGSLATSGLAHAPRTLADLRALGGKLGESLGDTLGVGVELVVRVNPDLPIDAEVTAGSLTTTGVRRFGRLRITAAAATLNGVTKVDDALVQAATATLHGQFTAGRSRVRLESGQLTVGLDAGSDVSVRGEAHAGRISWPGGHGAVDEYVVGEGSARLDLDVMMGVASLRDARVTEADPDTADET